MTKKIRLLKLKKKEEPILSVKTGGKPEVEFSVGDWVLYVHNGYPHVGKVESIGRVVVGSGTWCYALWVKGTDGKVTGCLWVHTVARVKDVENTLRLYHKARK